MTGNESEPSRALEVPRISLKTDYNMLKEFSIQRWPNKATRIVALNMIDNAKELLVEVNTNWDAVLNSIRIQRMSSFQLGVSAIAANYGSFIGSFAVDGDWAMHDPPVVYLSGKLLADIAKDSEELGGFKTIMHTACINYGLKVLSDANLYMNILDTFLELPDRNSKRHIMKKVVGLLKQGNVQEADKVSESLHTSVGRRRMS